jgi:hypothetical protein
VRLQFTIPTVSMDRADPQEPPHTTAVIVHDNTKHNLVGKVHDYMRHRPTKRQGPYRFSSNLLSRIYEEGRTSGTFDVDACVEKLRNCLCDACLEREYAIRLPCEHSICKSCLQQTTKNSYRCILCDMPTQNSTIL